MRFNSAGYTDTAPHWDPYFASFVAVTEGLVFGVPLAVFAYLVFFLPYPPRLIARILPLLFLGAVLGAIPGVWLGVSALFTVIAVFIASCLIATWRLRILVVAEKAR
jgi:hypothetical protein